MNIHMKTKSLHTDPFAQSDRGGFGKNAGKGDSPRSIGKRFRERFPADMGKNKINGKFRKVY